jgi:RimK-like ATP-grasp domain
LILLWGIPSEGPLERVLAALAARRAPVLVLNQRRMLDTRCEWTIDGDRATGRLVVDGQVHAMEDVDAVYTRAMDVDLLPEVRSAPPAVRDRARWAHEALGAWCEAAPIRMVNRTAAMGSNSSKPYQAMHIARHGFRVPETLITNQPDLVRDFVARHGRVVYKSASGVRSIARLFGPDDAARLERIRWCPTQFQELVEGEDVRVHVVGSRVFATKIRSTAVDYRYAGHEGEAAELSPVDLEDDVADRCIALSASLGLAFAGIDLKLTAADVFCFEANPSPGFTYFEAATGQPIAAAVADYLLAGDASRERPHGVSR